MEKIDVILGEISHIARSTLEPKRFKLMLYLCDTDTDINIIITLPGPMPCPSTALKKKCLKGEFE